MLCKSIDQQVFGLSGTNLARCANFQRAGRGLDRWRALNNDPEMKELAAKAGFELVNVGVEEMPAFMAEKTKLYTEGAARLGLGKK